MATNTQLVEKYLLTETQISLAIQFDPNVRWGSEYLESRDRAVAKEHLIQAIPIIRKEIEEENRIDFGVMTQDLIDRERKAVAEEIKRELEKYERKMHHGGYVLFDIPEEKWQAFFDKYR